MAFLDFKPTLCRKTVPASVKGIDEHVILIDRTIWNWFWIPIPDICITATEINTSAIVWVNPPAHVLAVLQFLDSVWTKSRKSWVTLAFTSFEKFKWTHKAFASSSPAQGQGGQRTDFNAGACNRNPVSCNQVVAKVLCKVRIFLENWNRLNCWSVGF